MNKIYQPFIINLSNDFVEHLENTTHFFSEEKIESYDYTKQIICDKLTEKFINGQLSSNDKNIFEIFDDNEFTNILNLIVVKQYMDNLLKMGLIDIIEDENDEECYFLTEDGKEYAKKINTTNINETNETNETIV